MPKDFQLTVKSQREKLEYGFVALIFASLALSIQFSPPLGKYYKYVLIISWILYIISGLVGCYKILVTFNVSIENLKANQAVDERGNLIEFTEYLVNLSDLNTKKRNPFILQIWFYFLALIANTYFVALNYLNLSLSNIYPAYISFGLGILLISFISLQELKKKQLKKQTRKCEECGKNISFKENQDIIVLCDPDVAYSPIDLPDHDLKTYCFECRKEELEKP
jgi:hypothetical protein